MKIIIFGMFVQIHTNIAMYCLQVTDLKHNGSEKLKIKILQKLCLYK
jgi:hypothetical protein